MLTRQNMIAVGALLLGMIVLIALVRGCGGERFSWRETYDQTSVQPYGAQVAIDLLKNQRGEANVSAVEDSLRLFLANSDAPEPASYFFLGPALFMDSLDTSALLAFVERGNTALVSSKTIPFDLMFHLYYQECEHFYWDDYPQVRDSLAWVGLRHPDLQPADTTRLRFLYQNIPTLYNWSFFPPEALCEGEEQFYALGDMNDSFPNFVAREYGEGRFYLHTTPLAFSNLALLEEKALPYAERVLSHLPEGKIYYDVYSRVPEGVGRRRNVNNSWAGRRTFNSENELSYILSQPPLAWAWYTALGLALCYLLFRAKRRQRVIPVLEQNRNTSLEFVSTIGRLYFLQNNHRKLGLQKFRLWKAHIRDNYGVHAREMDEAFVQKLAARSGVSVEVVEGIVNRGRVVERATNIHEHTLITFHRQLEEFYQQAR